ncbi:acyl-CoA dehydrogenase (plasmid) [Paracoccus versutus]|uniref:Acyl-CoA dehydrogenase n=1 Tax=Paracoccus versutus TaxID=34007 RepID=A0AAQ0HDM0_PARVE|nr:MULTISPECIES: acyl-CoA dehydrogenase family protein [Paracoccus]KGJ02414.1 acyl-CoA dehydrogenase [Paracoccus versutus]RDD69779.1 acyl-CoA dehydrogenase [Paracoccus versutus]REG26970.1 acyl-CoA dehydrogenase [Paracoccus versutus]WEJ82251.1 acyl-CoA dehydrogenase [Paracoccus versutus]
MGYLLTDDQQAIVDAAEKICENFPLEYWLKKERDHAFPHEFFQAVADGGWLGICMPEEFGGANLGVTEAALFLRTVAECGGQAAASTIHMNIFGLQPVVHFGTEEQKQRWLPPFARGEVKACFAVTEPDTGLDTTKLKVAARKQANGDYLISGKKVFISTAQQADHMLILARTTPIEEVRKHSEGLSLFYTKLDRDYVDIREIDKLGRAAVDTNELFIDNLPVSRDSLIGEEGKGLKYIFHGMNAERVFVAAEQVGIGRAVLKLATQYAKDRVVFGRPIGQNQGVQHPLARNWAELEAANLMLLAAAELYDKGLSCGSEANAAKLVASEACMKACNTAILTHGGFGYAKEYHVERFMREAWIGYIAPVTPQLILSNIAERKLGLPKSY